MAFCLQTIHGKAKILTHKRFQQSQIVWHVARQLCHDFLFLIAGLHFISKPKSQEKSSLASHVKWSMGSLYIPTTTT